jgi:hypothetical protein
LVHHAITRTAGRELGEKVDASSSTRWKNLRKILEQVGLCFIDARIVADLEYLKDSLCERNYWRKAVCDAASRYALPADSKNAPDKPSRVDRSCCYVLSAADLQCGARRIDRSFGST